MLFVLGLAELIFNSGLCGILPGRKMRIDQFFHQLSRCQANLTSRSSKARLFGRR